MQGWKNAQNNEMKNKNNKNDFNVILGASREGILTSRYRRNFYCTLEAPKKERLPCFPVLKEMDILRVPESKLIFVVEDKWV